MTTPGGSVPATQYVVVNKPSGGRTGQQQQSSGGSQGGGGGKTAPVSGVADTKQVRLPAGVPAFIGNRSTIFHAWGVSMIIVGFDEWHNYHILPRPSRFWYTSLTYGLLMLAGAVDAILPLATALAIGYTIMLLWQYYNGSGQFTQGKA